MQRFTSRKFLVVLAGMAYVVAQVFLGALSPSEGVQAVSTIALGYLAAEGGNDALRTLKGQ